MKDIENGKYTTKSPFQEHKSLWYYPFVPLR